MNSNFVYIKKNDNVQLQLTPINIFFNCKEKIYFIMLVNYLNKCNKKYLVMMINIINGNSNISLRILDWFISKYAKYNHLTLSNDYNNSKFEIYLNYKAQVKSYSKNFFDPFRRKKKFCMILNNKNKTINLYTTIGQLIFFKWIISNNVLEYVHNNCDLIIKSMSNYNKENKENKENKKNKLNKTLSHITYDMTNESTNISTSLNDDNYIFDVSFE
jgi:hypothetical protein